MIIEYRNYAFKNGLRLGLLYAFITFCFYCIDARMLFSGTTWPIVFYCLFLLFPIFLIKKQTFGLSTFKDFFSVIFLGFAVATFIHLVFNLILHNFIDPGVTEVYVAVMMEQIISSQAASEVFALSGGQNLDIYPPEMNKDYFVNNWHIKNQINAYVFFLIPCVLYSAFIALIKTYKK